MQLDTFQQLPFSNFTQQPSCGFDVDYSLTLIEKTFGSNEQPVFDLALEGITSFPEFAVFDPDAKYLSYRPDNQLLSARSFAVFISGHVQVNSTIQGPVSTVSEYFEVSIEASVTEL